MKKNYRYIIYIVLGVLLGYFGSKIDFNSIKNLAPQSCTYYGQTYKDGEGFQADCNSCSCNNGQVECTLMACEGS